MRPQVVADPTKWYLPSHQSTVVFNKNTQQFIIQKDSAHIALQPADFLNNFTKQYRLARPWYGHVSEWLGFGTLNKLKKQSTDAARIAFLFNHAKASNESTTAKTVQRLFQSTDFSDRISAQAMINRRDFLSRCVTLEKKEQAVREQSMPSTLIEFEKGLKHIDAQEKIERVQTQKLIVRRHFLQALERSFKLVWMSVNEDKRNFNANQKNYITVKDFGVTKIQYHLYFNEKEISALAAYVADDDSVKTHKWIQSVRKLYQKFCTTRDLLANIFLSDEEMHKGIDDFMHRVSQLIDAKFLDKNVFEQLSKARETYQPMLRQHDQNPSVSERAAVIMPSR